MKSLQDEDVYTEVLLDVAKTITTGYAKLASAQLWNDPLKAIGFDNSQDTKLSKSFYDAAVEATIVDDQATYYVFLILSIYCNPEIVNEWYTKLDNIEKYFRLMLYYMEK